MSPTGPSPTDALDALIVAAVERTVARLLPFVVDPRPPWTTPRSAKTLFGKSWRALDEWAKARGVSRHQVAGSPCYRTDALDAAIAATATAPTPPPANDSDDSDSAYRRAVSGAAGGR